MTRFARTAPGVRFSDDAVGRANPAGQAVT